MILSQLKIEYKTIVHGNVNVQGVKVPGIGDTFYRQMMFEIPVIELDFLVCLMIGH